MSLVLNKVVFPLLGFYAAFSADALMSKEMKPKVTKETKVKFPRIGLVSEWKAKGNFKGRRRYHGPKHSKRYSNDAELAILDAELKDAQLDHIQIMEKAEKRGQEAAFKKAKAKKAAKAKLEAARKQGGKILINRFHTR
jgi:hypothetical protein